MLAVWPARVSRALARRTGFRLFRFFIRRLGNGPVAMQGLQLRAARKEDLLAHCDDAELDLRKENLEQAFARGDLCVAAYDGGTLAGYCWLAFAPLHHLDGVWVEFDPRHVWTYKSFVLPAHRGRGIAPALYRYADAACRDRGRTRSLLCVEAHNTPSVAAALRSGYERLGYAAWLANASSLRGGYSPAVTQAGVRFYRP